MRPHLSFVFGRKLSANIRYNLFLDVFATHRFFTSTSFRAFLNPSRA